MYKRQHLDGTVYPLTLGIGLCSIGVATVAWTLVQRHGEPPRPAATPTATTTQAA